MIRPPRQPSFCPNVVVSVSFPFFPRASMSSALTAVRVYIFKLGDLRSTPSVVACRTSVAQHLKCEPLVCTSDVSAHRSRENRVLRRRTLAKSALCSQICGPSSSSGIRQKRSCPHRRAVCSSSHSEPELCRKRSDGNAGIHFADAMTHAAARGL